MLRAASLAVAFLLPTLAVVAADLPPDISPEARAAFVKKLVPLYEAERAKSLKDIEEAKALTKFAATEKEGKRKLKIAETHYTNLARFPWSVPGAGYVVIGEASVKAGDIGIVSRVGEFVATKLDEGVQIDGLIDPNGSRLLTRFVVASKFEVPKTVKGKKNPPLRFDGIWYVAGETEAGGKKVPVIYALVLKPEEVTGLAKKP